jgi:ABC-type glycerol-3-phosphate transport system substrate-binding protein
MRFLGSCLLALVLLLAGCGESSSSEAVESPTHSPTFSDPGPSEPLTVAIVSETAAGGEVDPVAVPVESDQDRQAFAAQFEQGEIVGKIGAAIGSATIPDAYEVVGAVVAIGCDVPTDVTATQGPDGWTLEPVMPSKTMQECFAPVTSVALVAVPA